MTTRYQILKEGGVWDHQTRTVVKRYDHPADWATYQEWLTQGGVPLPPSNVTMLELADAKVQKKAEIDAYAAGLRNRAVRGYSPAEMASWIAKLLDAMAVQSGQPSPFAGILPTLCAVLGIPSANSINDAIAQIRGITESQHMQRVFNAGLPFWSAEIAVDAIRGKHCDAIEAMTDVRDIAVYDWMTGWPDIP